MDARFARLESAVALIFAREKCCTIGGTVADGTVAKHCRVPNTENMIVCRTWCCSTCRLDKPSEQAWNHGIME
jgi:hypothetical protein